VGQRHLAVHVVVVVVVELDPPVYVDDVRVVADVLQLATTFSPTTAAKATAAAAKRAAVGNLVEQVARLAQLRCAEVAVLALHRSAVLTASTSWALTPLLRPCVMAFLAASSSRACSFEGQRSSSPSARAAEQQQAQQSSSIAAAMYFCK
jgi:hypothetical protein